MFNLKQILFLFYGGITLYVLLFIQISNLTLVDFWISLIILWTSYLFFSLGFNSNEIRNVQAPRVYWIFKSSSSLKIIVALIVVCFAITTAYFYTGQTPAEVIYKIKAGSTYYDYQSYFKAKQLEVFTIRKIPFILMNYFIKFTLFLSYISFFMSSEKKKLLDYLYLLAISLGYIYYGLARGTNYEGFEITILISFLLLKKQINRSRLKTYFVFFIVICLFFLFFQFQLGKRGVELYYVSSDIGPGSENILTKNFPEFSNFINRLFGYIGGFGLFYINNYAVHIWMNSAKEFVSGLIPFGYRLFGLPWPRDKMREIIDQGANWVPDFIVFKGYIGYLGILILCFILGRLSKLIHKLDIDKNIAFLIEFILFLEMLSLHNGNFIITSSASELIVVSLFIYLIFAGLKKYNKRFRYWRRAVRSDKVNIELQ